MVDSNPVKIDRLEVRLLRRGESARAVLRLEGLAVSVGMSRVLSDVALEVDEGDVLAIAGPNGSGKSTLLNSIAGLQPARVDAGIIRFEGQDITSWPSYLRASQGIGYLRQRENVFTDLTVEENLRLALGPDGLSRFQQHFPRWGPSLPAGKRAGVLSGGQRQRLAWGMAVLRPSKLLLMDEPEAGLSEPMPLPKSVTTLVVSHSFDTLEVSQ